ncbi:hypothetical protein SAY86_012812 [Trapa natans]|uniref:Protein LURP-one-related 8 n=1 Tax=Trapa natans TaxID=22666 RepID=A0AAN7LSR6_TRANT|nr:hypothetical protein SAY86_012812 [Trapa natans]
MTKVYPNANLAALTIPAAATARAASRQDDSAGLEVLTVWRKSLLLSCKGFTVYDSRGNLVFRVDSYSARRGDEIVLMDASGKPLLTTRRKQRLILGDSWQVFDGETAVNPRFTARKQSNLPNRKCLAQVSCGSGSPSPSPSSSSSSSSWRRGSGGGGRSQLAYEIEGSYGQRGCVIYDEKRRVVAEIQRKESFGNDVFRLVVQREMIDTEVAMTLVILLDQMFGSSSGRFSS